ncbi:MAG: hypothetical protein ACRCZF_06105, partial [Gemmataceae bacterium]
KVEIKREEMKLAPMVQEDNSGFSGLGSSTNSQSVEDILAPLDGKKPEKKEKTEPSKKSS